MISLVSLVATASAAGAALSMCSKKERQPVRQPTKSSKSSKSRKSASKSGASSKSHRSKSRRHSSSKKSSKSNVNKHPSEIEKDPKADRKSMRSEERKGKSKSRSGEKSRKSSKSGKSSSSGSGEKTNSGEKALKSVPNHSKYTFPEGQVKPSQMRVSPNKLPFATTGGVQSVVISNSTKERKAFKVKTSDNLLFRVNPVYGFMEPGASVSIDVLRHNGEQKTDHLVVLTSDAAKEQVCAKSHFEAEPLRELTVVPLVTN